MMKILISNRRSSPAKRRLFLFYTRNLHKTFCLRNSDFEIFWRNLISIIFDSSKCVLYCYNADYTSFRTICICDWIHCFWISVNVINYNIGRCGWQDHPNKWFISFYASDRKYGKIMRCLTEIGEFKVNTRPNGQVDLWFEEN